MSLFQKLFRKYGSSRRNQTILDQLIVSASNFATGVLLVRGLGLTQFGRFTVAYTLILLANNVQLSFISSPMISFGALCATPQDRGRYVRGMFGVQLVFGAIVTVVTGIAAVAILWVKPQYGSMRLIPALACGVLMFLMQDWLRRYYFTVGKAWASIWNDAISYIGQLIVLLVLAVIHQLSVVSALWAIALTSGAAFAMGVFFERLGFTVLEIQLAWRRSRSASRDLAIASQLQWFVYQGAMLIGANVLGAQAAGSVRATQNVVGPVNVGFQAMENLVPIKAGEEMRRGGVQQVAAFLLRFGAKGFLLLSIVFLGIGAFAKDFLSFFYGHQVAVYSGILDLQFLYFLLVWPLRQFNYLFRTIGRTGAILWSSLAAAMTSLVLIYPFVHRYNALGIMLAAVSGQIANLVWMAAAWLRMRPSLQAEPESFSTMR